MEKYETAREEALKNLKIADHILTMTYPLVQDPKLLKFVIKKVHLSMQNTMAMVLYFERKYKRIPPFTENYETMLRYLKPILSKNNLSISYVSFLEKLNDIIMRQSESNVEFIRKDKFVFASNNYDLSIISEKEIKDYVAKAKIFMHQIMGVMDENERLVR